MAAERNPAASRFTRWSSAAAHAVGRPWAFLLSVAVLVVWALTGPLFGWSDTWQLVINTGTTVVTFLMVFLIQRSQNKEAIAVQVKLDELIRAVKGARNNLIAIEDLSEDELGTLKTHFEKLAGRAEEARRQKETP